jgi:type II secretory pathway component PulF
MAAVLTFTMAYVLPRFADLFAGMEDELPVTTRFLISAAALAHSRWWLLPPITVGVILAVRWGLSSGVLGRVWDRAKILIFRASVYC